jgi:hypothetical protein
MTSPSLLHVVSQAPKRKKRGVTLAQAKRALRLFRSEYVSREVRHANARKWLASVEWLGPRWALKGGEVRWGTKRNGGEA